MSLTLQTIEPDALYTPGEVAVLFRVVPKTVVRWIKTRKFKSEEYTRTAGGHHRVTGAGILRLKRESGGEGRDGHLRR